MSLVSQSVAGSAGEGNDAETAGVGTVLVYELSTEPDPVRVSPAEGAVERADLVIVGSRHSDSGIEARKLTVYIPTGTASAELALDLTGIAAQTSLPGWTPAADPTNQRIVFAPPSGTATIEPGQGVTIQLGGIRINRVVGSAPVVLELEYRAVGTSAWRTDTTTLGVGKFPAGFYLRNLRVDPLVVENGGTATLEWEASQGATYKLLYGTAEIDVTNRRDYPVTNIRQSTMFYLRAIAQAGNDHVERTLNVSVTVNKPDMVVRNLTIEGQLEATGPVQLFAAPQRIEAPFTGTAPSDGFLWAYVPRGQIRLYIGPDSTARRGVLVAGPDATYYGDQKRVAFPVRKGESVSINLEGGDGLFFWFSFGGLPLG
ncbi:hypothetical protein [Embleya sp. NBC_00896]|uniref:hypothetical protein n=1 Tax=Embleya sp. NBC_00896 TaxID=2975961 RepID=UPI00386907AC|nr:hypothetical protein OG928_01020 [Embleya sp. NBC_00896]